MKVIDPATLTDEKLLVRFDHACTSLYTAHRGDPYRSPKESQANWEKYYDEVMRRGLWRQTLKP